MNVQGDLGDNNSENHLVEPSQTSNEIQVWTQILEQKSNDRISKMREEMDNKLETILKEIRSNKNLSTTTNPRSEKVETQNPQLSGSRSMGFCAYNIENSDLENEDHSLRASGSKDLRHPAKPLYSDELDLDATMNSNEDSEEEDFHRCRLETFSFSSFILQAKTWLS